MSGSSSGSKDEPPATGPGRCENSDSGGTRSGDDWSLTDPIEWDSRDPTPKNSQGGSPEKPADTAPESSSRGQNGIKKEREPHWTAMARPPEPVEIPKLPKGATDEEEERFTHLKRMLNGPLSPRIKRWLDTWVEQYRLTIMARTAWDRCAERCARLLLEMEKQPERYTRAQCLIVMVAIAAITDPQSQITTRVQAARSAASIFGVFDDVPELDDPRNPDPRKKREVDAETGASNSSDLFARAGFGAVSGSPQPR